MKRFLYGKNSPEKPETLDAQVSMLWDGLYNHLPSWLEAIELKMNFVLVFLGLLLGFLAILVARLP